MSSPSTAPQAPAAAPVDAATAASSPAASAPPPSSVDDEPHTASSNNAAAAATPATGSEASPPPQQQQQQPPVYGGSYHPSRRVTLGGHPNPASGGAGGTTSSTSTNNPTNIPPSQSGKNQQQPQQQGPPPPPPIPPPPMMGSGGGGGPSSGFGVGSSALDRRGSMGSAFGNMDDFFGIGPGSGRRPSFGFHDMSSMDAFLASGRRDSMDSTTAALDAAIMDLSRRRYSTAMGGLPPPPPPPMNEFGGGPQGSMGFGGVSAGGSSQGSGTAHESIAQRQQQLQQQQRELEHRQRELEDQRQQLIASMQARSYQPMGGGGGSTGAPPRTSSMGGAGGSLGLGSVHSHGSGSMGIPPPPPPSSMGGGQVPSSSAGAGTMPPHRTSGGSGGSQQWWICQVCNSKAFASHDEAMAHEVICQEGGGGGGSSSQRGSLGSGSHHAPPPYHHHPRGGGGGHGMDPTMQPFPMHPQDSMSMATRNFSMGLGGGGMETSQRQMSMGMGGTMDNSARGVVSMGMSDSSRGGSIGFDSSRNMSLGMDSSTGSYVNDRPLSMGPFAMLTKPMPLAMPSDKDWLTPLHCFVRRHCVEVFTATEKDVATPSKGKRKPIQVGQVGIRCPHCHILDSNGSNNKARERGSVYYPTTIASIYNATMNLLQRHLHNCPAVPDDIMRRYETLKADDARSGTSKRYWIESALSLGLVDTNNGIRHSALRPPPLPSLTRQQESTGQTRRNSNEMFSTKSNAVSAKAEESGAPAARGNDKSKGPAGGSPSGKGEKDTSNTAPLVTPEDKPYATTFSYHLLGQMQPCVFTEADRLGKRKGLPPGFPGLACRHCFGGYGSGRFFPSSIKTLSDTSKTLNVLHNHMMRCRKCPADVKEELEKLRGTHDEERAKMKFGSQKAFFARIWERLHGKDHPGSLKRSAPSHASRQHGYPSQQHSQHQRMMAPMPQYGHHMPPPQMQRQQPHTMPPRDTGGLDALAAASSPRKRQKTDSM